MINIIISTITIMTTIIVIINIMINIDMMDDGSDGGDDDDDDGCAEILPCGGFRWVKTETQPLHVGRSLLRMDQALLHELRRRMASV
eukprot:1893762-Karenia_brevis.AAC.1